jgi:hypothetical protein
MNKKILILFVIILLSINVEAYIMVVQEKSYFMLYFTFSLFIAFLLSLYVMLYIIVKNSKKIHNVIK